MCGIAGLISGSKIDEAGLKFIVSPYDEFALEEAIRLKEKGVARLQVGHERRRPVPQVSGDAVARLVVDRLPPLGDVLDAEPAARAVAGDLFAVAVAGAWPRT